MSTEATSSALADESAPRGALHIGLWVVQVILALMFGMAGAMKALTPIDELAVDMAWVTAVPPACVRFVGASELLGAIGLIVPAATRIRPKLTGYAASGIALIMALAAALHLYLGEASMVPINVVLGALAGFVIWGRLVKAPISPR